MSKNNMEVKTKKDVGFLEFTCPHCKNIYCFIGFKTKKSKVKKE